LGGAELDETFAPRVSISDLGPILVASDALASEALRSAGGVTPVEIADALDATNAIARAYYSHPAPTVFLTAHRLHVWADTRRSICQDPKLARDLDYILSRTHGILACTCLDLNHAITAHRHVRASVLRAQFAGDSEMEGWALGTEALILRFQGRNDQSREAAQRGISLGLSSPTAARLHSQASASAARLGDLESALSDLADAEELMEATPHPEMVDGVLGFSQAMGHYYRGVILLDCGAQHALTSREASEQAVELFQGESRFRSRSDEVVAHIHIAQAHALAGEYDGIESALDPINQPEFGRTTSWQFRKLDQLLRSLEKGSTAHSRVLSGIEMVVETFKTNLVSAQHAQLANVGSVGELEEGL